MENKLLKSTIPELYLKGSMADVYFAVKSDDGFEVAIPAHKCILSAGSEVFESLFASLSKDNDTVEIDDIEANAFQEFLQFFYLTKVELTMENIIAVSHLTDKYNMDECYDVCEKFLVNQETDDSLICTYQLAIELNHKPNMQSLKATCEKRLRGTPCDVLKSDFFLRCSREVLKHILLLNGLSCSDFDLFNFCVAWAKASCERKGIDESDAENLKLELGECFYLIRYRSITLEQIALMFSDKLVNNLFSREELMDVMRLKSDKYYESTFFKCKS